MPKMPQFSAVFKKNKDKVAQEEETAKAMETDETKVCSYLISWPTSITFAAFRNAIQHYNQYI